MLAQALYHQIPTQNLVILSVPLLLEVEAEVLRLRVLAVLVVLLRELAVVMGVLAVLLLPFSAVLLAVVVREGTPEMVVKAQLMPHRLLLVAQQPELAAVAGAVLVEAAVAVAVAVVVV